MSRSAKLMAFLIVALIVMAAAGIILLREMRAPAAAPSPHPTFAPGQDYAPLGDHGPSLEVEVTE